ncbi:protein UpsX [Sulfuracidifex tepidarius]|nr:hypothetical protein [Sulfuracidifex tepidarius]
MIDIDEVDAREWVVKVGDSFHYYEGNKIKRKEETGRDILDFITIDGEINKVRKVGKKVEIAGNIYDLFERKLDRAVFSDKQKLFLSFNNKLHSFDSPLYFILGNSVISLLYEDYNLLFDFISSRKEIFKDGLMHLSIKENVGVDSKGRIYIDDSLVGICKKEYISFIGKLNGNNVLLCGNEIKQYMGGSWYNIGVTNNSDNVKANGELLAFVNDDMLHVFNIDLVEIGKFVDVTGFDISSKEVYILKKNKWYGVLDLFPINEITVLNSNITYSSSLVISYPLLSRIKVTPINGRITSLDLEKCQVHIDPVNFDNKIKLKLDSNFYSFDIEFPVNVEKVSVSLVRPTIVMGPDGFKILKAPRSNSYMKANLKYISSIETKLKIQIGNLEKDIQLEKGKFNEKIIIPLNLDKLDHEVVKLCTDKNFCKEYVIPIKVLDSTGAEINKKIKIRNSFVEIEEDRKLDLFEQHQITARSISVYKSILRARVGDILNLDGKEIKVEPGLRRIFISQENETREFLIEGVETPLLDFSAKIEGNDLVLSTKLSRKAGMEIIYCSDDWRDLVEGNAAIKLNLLPECSNLIVSLYDGDLIWRYNYNLDLTVSSFIKTAYLNSIKIKQHLETFGIL